MLKLGEKVKIEKIGYTIHVTMFNRKLYQPHIEINWLVLDEREAAELYTALGEALRELGKQIRQDKCDEIMGPRE